MQLQRPFYERPARQVARELLGKVLVHRAQGLQRAGRIVETEAYIGEHDLACHASKGRTARTDVMFGAGGHAYVYLIYGMYSCFNVVTERKGVAAAVLVRGLEPVEGIPTGVRTDGPGKLCRALGISRAHNHMDLLGPTLFILDAPAVPPKAVARGPRVGVDYSGAWAKKPYRFWVKDNPHVSAP
jgi:DNA-3-methyladenine glycosylase